MRVFRKRQLRLREADGKTLRVYGNPNDVPGTMKNLQNLSTQIGTGVTASFPKSGSSNKVDVNYNRTGAINASDIEHEQKKAYDDGYGFNVTVDTNGNISGGTNNNSGTNESRFSGNLIESAVIFSKRELSDFLKRI